jgi:hypothetical protein
MALPKSAELYYLSKDESEFFVISCKSKDQADAMRDVLRRRDYKLDRKYLIKNGFSFISWSESTGDLHSHDSQNTGEYVEGFQYAESGLVADVRPWSYLSSAHDEAVGSAERNQSDADLTPRFSVRRRVISRRTPPLHAAVEAPTASSVEAAARPVPNRVAYSELFKEQSNNLPDNARKRVDLIIGDIRAGRVPHKMVSCSHQKFIVDDVTNLGMHGRGGWRLMVEKMGKHEYRIVGIGDYHRNNLKGDTSIKWWSEKRA